MIEGETMQITIYPGEGKPGKVTKVTADNAQSSYAVRDGTLVVSLLNKKENAEAKVTVAF